MPQGSRVMGFNEETAALAHKVNQSRLNLLHVSETNDLHYFKVTHRIIGLDWAFSLAGLPAHGPARVASEFRALAFFDALHNNEITRAAHIFSLIAADGGFPDLIDARRDNLPDIYLALVALAVGRKTPAIDAKIRIFLAADPARREPDFAPRKWAFLIPKIAATDTQIASRLAHFNPELRALLKTTFAEIAADPETSAQLWTKWRPLLLRLYPRLKTP